ncbi:hypothetical protein SLEP1_g10629 [Rubroshorea leprosula]|uniref:NB-ARC domain-containing protein n=1 Tax=Rubroshorea leprosula TaxID=152421 RepID=A0AAV5IH73_9ROSI|nr:hypothetical protein SLEP1_g10629 [Rubroshorea leprosula]
MKAIFNAHTTWESVLGHPNPFYPPTTAFMSMLASYLEDALTVKVKTNGIDVGGNIIKPENGSTQVHLYLSVFTQAAKAYFMADAVVSFLVERLGNLLIEETTLLWGVRDQLVNEEKCRVVSISGIGGLGKTTMAKAVYHHGDIRRHFEGFAWAYVFQQCKRRDVWEGILLKLITPSREEREEILRMRDDDLAKKLYKVQKEKRCLVVIDDIWSTEAWSTLSATFPNETASGSKVLLTTRNKKVALIADREGFVHEPNCLNEEKSWELFQRKAFPRRGDSDADKRQDEHASVRNWVSGIRDATYDIEDVIDSFVLKFAPRNGRRIHNPITKGIALHNLASKIDKIKSQIIDLTRSLQTYGITARKEEGTSLAFERQRVVSICGIGGLGKTTMAKAVYHHGDIRRHFEGFAWAYVSQQCKRRDVWEGILLKLITPSREEREEILRMRDDDLAKKLYKVQKEKKCLIVIDDIWSTEAWSTLSAAFPNETASGSKILLTTRNKEVALISDREGLVHEPNCLNEEKSWELFQRKAFPRRGDSDTCFNFYESGDVNLVAAKVLGYFGILLAHSGRPAKPRVFLHVRSYCRVGSQGMSSRLDELIFPRCQELKMNEDKEKRRAREGNGWKLSRFTFGDCFARRAFGNKRNID